MGRLFRIYWNFVSLLVFQKRVGGFKKKKKKWGDNRMKTFYSEMWEKPV